MWCKEMQVHIFDGGKQPDEIVSLGDREELWNWKIKAGNVVLHCAFQTWHRQQF